MRGHEALIDMRKKGIRPRAADICLASDKQGFWQDWERWASEACIEVETKDVIERLDLRCIVGMWVFAWGFEADRVKALHQACIDAGAEVVMSSVYRTNRAGELVLVEGMNSLKEAA
jgi:hypothetical protein